MATVLRFPLLRDFYVRRLQFLINLRVMCHMDVTSFFKITVLGFLVVGALAGCHHPSPPATAPTRLACLIADTDHIVVTYRPPETPGRHHPLPIPDKYRDFSLAISGDEARKIVRDVSVMTDDFPNFSDSIWSWQMRFYRGEDSLATVNFDSGFLLCEEHEYVGDTGALQALSRKLWKLNTPPNER